MAVSPIKDNALLIDLIKTSSGVNKFFGNEQDDASTRTKFPPKDTASQEQKSTLVSENANEKSSFIPYNYRLDRSVPLSKSEKPERPYHNPKKESSVEVKDEETGELVDSEIIEEEPTENNLGKGYYVNGGSPSFSEKQSKSLKELFQEKINRVYNVGFIKEPGTLVNLVV